MSLDTRVSELIKGIYSAGGDRSAWDNATVELFQLMGCCGGLGALVGLNRMDLVSCRIYAPPRPNGGSAVDEYAALYRRDPVLDCAIQGVGRFCNSVEMDKTTPSFAAWTRQTFASTHWYGGFASPARDLIFYLVAHFASEPGPEALKQFEIVFDHFECAMRVGGRPFNQDSARALLRLDIQGCVEQVSKGTERLLRGASPVTLADHRLVATGRAEQKNLDRAFERVLGQRGAEAAPTAVHLAPESGRPWIVVMRPVVELFGPFGALRRKVDVELLDHIPVIGRLDVVQSLFDLTGRELQVLGLLAQGHSIDSLSAQIEVSRNTTRAHLRSIFSKTRTNSQTELMQLCGGLSSLAISEREVADLVAVN